MKWLPLDSAADSFVSSLHSFLRSGFLLSSWISFSNSLNSIRMQDESVPAKKSANLRSWLPEKLAIVYIAFLPNLLHNSSLNAVSKKLIDCDSPNLLMRNKYVIYDRRYFPCACHVVIAFQESRKYCAIDWPNIRSRLFMSALESR